MDVPQHDPATGSVCSLAPSRPTFEVVLPHARNRLLAPPRRFDPEAPELIDQPGLERRLLRQELQTLEQANRRLGGHGLVLRCLKRLLEAARPGPLSVLDLATGAADIPRAIAHWSRRCGRPVSITAVDNNMSVLDIAREACTDWPEIRLELHDLLDLPYPPGSFDLVLCSTALHHFSGTDAVTVLRRTHELARIGYLVNDLRRNWLAIWTTELVVRTMIRSPFMRRDAPHSCRAAFTLDELRALAVQAGLRDFRIERHHSVFRMVLEGRK
jgi:2-polyprenyl-3-methyl-5-hydroxy-6-metoxy-1,4-benzoquinol methylase